MRKPIIAGNWKMNMTPAEAERLVAELIPLVKDAACEVVVCPPYVDLALVGKLLAGTNIVHVPSKGSAAAIIEMKANRVQVMFDALVLPQSADGRIKTLAVLAPKRLDTHPDIPTHQ